MGRVGSRGARVVNRVHSPNSDAGYERVGEEDSSAEISSEAFCTSGGVRVSPTEFLERSRRDNRSVAGEKEERKGIEERRSRRRAARATMVFSARVPSVLTGGSQ